MTVGCATPSNMVRIPPRNCRKNGFSDVERGKDRDDVAELDRHIVVFGISVVARLAAAARIDRNHPSRAVGPFASAGASASKSATVRAKPGRQTIGIWQARSAGRIRVHAAAAHLAP